MADEQTNDRDLAGTIAEQVVAKALTIENLARIGKVSENTLIETLKVLFYVVLRIAVPVAGAALESLGEAMEATADQRTRILATTLRNTFNVDIHPSELQRTLDSGGGGAVAGKVTTAVLAGLTGGSSSVEPSTVPASRYVNVVLQQALEGWQAGATIEMLSGLIPGIEQMQLIGDAGDRVANALGISDSSSRVLRPYIDTLVVEPLRRHIDRTYRPTMLAPAAAVREFSRGRWTRERMVKELSEQGWSDERIDALVASNTTHLSESNLLKKYFYGYADFEATVQGLQALGYERNTATVVASLSVLDEFGSMGKRVVDAAERAFIDNKITSAEFRGFVDESLMPDDLKRQRIETATALAVLNQKELSPAEARACVKAGILSVSDYRAALYRDGYTVDAVLALELLLRHELDERSDIEDLRRRAAEERAAEQRKRDEAAAKRKLEIEAERARRRRGSISDLEQAVIRGIVSIARLEEVLAAEYDADTVAILVELVEQDRLAFLARQQQRDDAEQRGVQRGLSVGELERAVLAHIIPIQDYRARLEQLGFPAGDAEILTATLAARLVALEAAKLKRDEADTAAKGRRIDLGRFEQLVRRGARSLGDYDALLADLGFDDAARAAMRELLELQIADDAATRQLRDAAAAQLRERGLSLAQFERAVLLGVRSIDQFDAFLLAQGFNADARVALLALLRERLAEADAARARRDATEDTTGPRDLPLATARRAARLGVISPDAYSQRLLAAGYSPDDAAIDLELLLLEIADVQAARDARDQANADTAARGLALADVERAVKLGVQSIEDYRAAAAAAGYDAPAVGTLVDILLEELAQLAEARARRQQVETETDGQELSLAQLAAAVKAGRRTFDDYFAGVRTAGYSFGDAFLLTQLLADELALAWPEPPE